MNINFDNSSEMKKIFDDIYKYEEKILVKMLKKFSPIKCAYPNCSISWNCLDDKNNKNAIELMLKINILQLFIDVVFENSHTNKKIKENIKKFNDKYRKEYINLKIKDEEPNEKLMTEIGDDFVKLTSTFEKEVPRNKTCSSKNNYFCPQSLIVNNSRILQISSNKKINVPNFESFIWTKLILNTVPLLYSMDEKAFDKALTIIFPMKDTYKGDFYKIMHKLYTDENNNDIDIIMFFYYIEQILRPSLIMSIDELAYKLSQSIYDSRKYYNRITFLSIINENSFAQILPLIINLVKEYPFSYNTILQMFTDEPFEKINILNMCINIKYEIKKKYGSVLAGYLYKTNASQGTENTNTSNILCEFIKNNKQYYYIYPRNNFEMKSNSAYIVNITTLTFLLNNNINFNYYNDYILNFPFNKFYSDFINIKTFSEEEVSALNAAIEKVTPKRYNFKSKKYTASDILAFAGLNNFSPSSKLRMEIISEFYKIIKKSRKRKK